MEYNAHSNPGRKRFEAHEVRRIPVSVSESARRCIVRSSSQGRTLPQALSEGFGSLGDVAMVQLDLVPKAAHFPLTILDQQHTPGRDPDLLVIRAQPTDTQQQEQVWYINAHDLEQVHLHSGGLGTFEARHLTSELLRLYRQQHPRKE